jgi:hypothetical protein
MTSNSTIANPPVAEQRAARLRHAAERRAAKLHRAKAFLRERNQGGENDES